MTATFSDGYIDALQIALIYDQQDIIRKKQFEFEEALSSLFPSPVPNGLLNPHDPNAMYFALLNNEARKQAIFGRAFTTVAMEFSDTDISANNAIDLIEQHATAVRDAITKLVAPTYSHTGIIAKIDFETTSDEQDVAAFLSQHVINNTTKKNVIALEIKLGFDWQDGTYRNYETSIVKKVRFITNGLTVMLDGDSVETGKKALSLKLDINDRGTQKRGEPFKTIKELCDIMKCDLKDNLKNVVPLCLKNP